MTLPTTRIDTLSPARNRVHGESQSTQNLHNSSSDQQEILLVDFVPNNVGGSHAHINADVANIVNRTTTNYPVQVQPIHSIHPNHVNHNNNDLSNFTLVNLSNQPETTGDNDDDESTQLFVKRHVALKRSSLLPGGGTEPISSGGAAYNGKLSSSLTSSSDDSDTGFLVPQNGIKGRSLGKDRQYRFPAQNSHPSTSYPGSPGYNSAVQQAHRKRLRRRRSSVRRKPPNHHLPETPEPGDLVSLCCCFGDEPNSHDPQHSSSSLTSKYLRFSCFIVLIIAIATFASIMVSLQRKVDGLSWEVSKMNAATSSQSTPKTIETNSGNRNQSPSVVQDLLLLKQQQLNSSYISLKASVDELSQRVSNLEKQPSVEEVRKDLARLGSDLEGSIKEMQKDIENVKNNPTPEKASEVVSGNAKDKNLEAISDTGVTSSSTTT